MRYTTFIKKQNYYNTKALITQSFKESIEYRVLRIELRKRAREKRRRRIFILLMSFL
jgi:hypothetical protein